MIIPNHYSAKLSALDLRMAVEIPPGGNWKNIPVDIPSQRLEQIRTAYKSGGGSRSTYYGRLRPDAPSYTINTNFHRPGNGCHLHYDFLDGQHRVISQREAARLQSFPDEFIFWGNKASINDQIGNAVPPLLAYQIANQLPFQGDYVDLFSGAGGLSLGFKWAGWTPIVANDVEKAFLDTYKHNIDNNIVLGDIRDKTVFTSLVDTVKNKRASKNSPLLVLGGPPCQGFSTAGNRRTMDDDRNRLFYEYKSFLEEVKPDAFLFENVPGLTNMEGGKVFEMIKSELSSAITGDLDTWIIHAEEYGIPQRRKRVIIVGYNTKELRIIKPEPVTAYKSNQLTLLPPSITVEEAICDLPPLVTGEDGSNKNYLIEPKNPYQSLMRGIISPKDYLEWLEKRGNYSEIS